MSYARFGWDGSDVYVIGTCHGEEKVIECCGCLMTPAGSFPAYTAKQDIIGHLRRHQELGHHVPDYVFTEIEGDDWIE